MSDARTGEDTHIVTRRYRRPPGGWWWLALALVPLLLALLGGLGGGDDAPASASSTPTDTATSTSPTATDTTNPGATDTTSASSTPTDTTTSASPTASSSSPTPTESTSTPTPSSSTTTSVTAGSIACGSFTKDVSGILRSNPITFTSGGTGLTGSSQQTVNAVAAALKKCDTMAAVVTGFTDNTGSAEANRQVSAQRAATVRNALVAAGVPASRVGSVGAGAERPIADNGTEGGRAQNRRVEIVAN